MSDEVKVESGVTPSPGQPQMRVGEALLRYALSTDDEKKSFEWPAAQQHMLTCFRSFSDVIASTEGRLQKYELVKRVGEAVSGGSWRTHAGSSAAVFKARVRDLNQALPVAIRLVINCDQHDQTTRSLTTRLAKETGLLCRDGPLGLHPNVLPILDHFVDLLPSELPQFDIDRSVLASRTAFSVTPLCQMSLLQLLEARLGPQPEINVRGTKYGNGVLSERVVIHMALGIAAGLNHLHQHYVVHRDVKPDNILLYWTEDHDADTLRQASDEVLLQCVPIVADLGESINHALRRSFVVEYNDGYSLGGATGYLPPEIRNARVDVDQLDYAKSDVYGLGCVMYAMMHRQPAIPIAFDTGLNATDLPAYYSQELRELVAACTAEKEARCSILEALQRLARLEKFTHAVRYLPVFRGRPTHCYGVALTRSGLLLLPNKRCVVHVVDAATGAVVTQWGTANRRGNAVVGEDPLFKNPWGVAVDEGRGRAYVSDHENSCVVVVSLSSGQVEDVWGREGTGQQQFLNPCSLEYCPTTDQLYVADRGNNCVKVLDPSNGRCVQVIGAQQRLKSPEGVAVDATQVYIPDNYDRVMVFSKQNGEFLFQFGQGRGRGPEQFTGPCGVCVDQRAGLVYVADAWGCRICVYGTDGKYLHNFPTLRADKSTAEPADVLWDAERSELYVTLWRSEPVCVYSYV